MTDYRKEKRERLIVSIGAFFSESRFVPIRAEPLNCAIAESFYNRRCYRWASRSFQVVLRAAG